MHYNYFRSNLAIIYYHFPSSQHLGYFISYISYYCTNNEDFIYGNFQNSAHLMNLLSNRCKDYDIL